jgi:hypothetical protein
MSITTLDISEPFFTTRVLEDEDSYTVNTKTIVLNLSEHPIKIEKQELRHLQSVVVAKSTIYNLKHAVLVERFAEYDDEESLLAKVREEWPSAFEIRGEERLRGIGHYMSPKVWLGQFGFTMYHSSTVPLNVGLHREHDFCPVPGFREVHTQIIGFGKMQQCRERDIETLYLEEPMAPGTTHRPMFDEEGNYPWHQFETITPSIFMAVEMLPEGVNPPSL